MDQLTEFIGAALPFLILTLAAWFIIWLASNVRRNFRVITVRLRRLRLADALYAAVTLIFFHLVWVNINSDSFLRPIVALYRSGEAAKTPVLKQGASIDEAFSSFSQKGNVFLRFIGFNPDNKDDHDFMELYYYRAAYAAYPRRVYCADPRDAITKAADIAK